MSRSGTRDAAANWQRLVSQTMKHLVFVGGKYNPCTFWHPKMKIRVCGARAKEVNYLKRKPVYVKIPRTEAKRNQWKFI